MPYPIRTSSATIFVISRNQHTVLRKVSIKAAEVCETYVQRTCEIPETLRGNVKRHKGNDEATYTITESDCLRSKKTSSRTVIRGVQDGGNLGLD
jgi:hypothetical protein